MFYFSFARPYFLVFLLALPFIFYNYHKGRLFPRPKGATFQFRLTVAIITFLVFGLAELQYNAAPSGQCVVFVLDVSKSVSLKDMPKVSDWISGLLPRLQRKDKAGLVAFAQGAKVMASPADYSRGRFNRILSDLPGKIPPDLNRDRTSIQRGLALGAGIVPEGYQPHLILISDGQENLDEVLPQALKAKFSGLALDVLPLPQDTAGEIWLEAVQAPPRVNVGQEFELRLKLSGELKGSAVLQIFLDQKGGTPWKQHQLELPEGRENQVYGFPLHLDEPGEHLLWANLIILHDIRPENNQGGVWVEASGPPSILYVSRQPNPPSLLLQTIRNLVAPGFIPGQTSGGQAPALRIARPEDVPDDLARYRSFGVVILDNVPAWNLTLRQQQAMERYVHTLSGGVLAVGGDEAYGAGGYADTELAKFLPVSMSVQVPHHDKKCGVELVLDKSGSMSKHISSHKTKMETAVGAAIASLEQLDPQDGLGVVTFDSEAYPFIPITPLKQSNQIAEKMNKISPEGKTDVYAALKLAYKWLKDYDADIKHILLISDGKTPPAKFEQLIGEITGDKITISAVGIGLDYDEAILSQIAGLGKGRLFLSKDMQKLDNIFANDLLTAGKSLIRQGKFALEASSPHEILAGMPAMSGDVTGYVAAKPRPAATTLWTAPREKVKEPILVVWNYGQGKVASLTTDSGVWARDLYAGNYGRQACSRLIGWLQADFTQSGDLFPAVYFQQGLAQLRVEAIDSSGRFINHQPLTAKMIYPDFGFRSLKLMQTKPGLYEAQFPLSGSGSYMVQIQGATGDRRNGNLPAAKPSIHTNFIIPYPTEYKIEGANFLLLNKLVQTAHGRMLDWKSDPLQDRQDVQPSSLPLALYCLMITLGLFVLLIIGRKIIPKL